MPSPTIGDLTKFALDVHNFAYNTEYNDEDIVSAMDFDGIIEKMKTDEKKLIDANERLGEAVGKLSKDNNRLKRLIVKEKKHVASMAEAEKLNLDLQVKMAEEIDKLETDLKKVPKKSMNYKYMKEMEEQIKESHLKMTDILCQLDEQKKKEKDIVNCLLKEQQKVQDLTKELDQQKSFAAGHQHQADENHVRYLDEQVKVYEQTEKVKELTEQIKQLEKICNECDVEEVNKLKEEYNKGRRIC